MSIDILDRSSGNPNYSGDALVPVQYYPEIFKVLPDASVAARMFTTVPMANLQTRVPVLSQLPFAYFVNGEASSANNNYGQKSTTVAGFQSEYLNAQEIAVIQPIPDALVADSQFDIWGTLLPFIVAAIGRALDGAIFFGNQIPNNWGYGNTGLSVLDGAIKAGNVYHAGTNDAAEGGLALDIAEYVGKVEEDGFVVTNSISDIRLRRRIRGARNSLGNLFPELTAGIQEESWYSYPVDYALPGLWPQGYTLTGGATTAASTTVVVASTTGVSVGDIIQGDSANEGEIPANSTVVTVTDGTHLVLSAPAGATETGLSLINPAVVALSGQTDLAILGLRQDITVKLLTEAVVTDSDNNIIFNLPQQDMSAVRVVFRAAYAQANPQTYLQANASQRFPWGVLLGS
jgi:hypothetical protein